MPAQASAERLGGSCWWPREYDTRGAFWHVRSAANRQSPQATDSAVLRRDGPCANAVTQGGHISTEPRINERIRVPEVRLVGPAGEQVGIVAINDALRLAQEADLDLVEVAPMARPPVAKLMDYGKFKYESALKARESRKNQAQTVIKEIKLRPKIDPHDYGTKKGHVERFLKQGDKVKVTIMFRGREQSRPELGFKLLQRLAGDIEELGFVESSPKQDGRNMIMVLGPHRRKTEAMAAAKADRASRSSARNAEHAAQAGGAGAPGAEQAATPAPETELAGSAPVAEAPATEAPATEAPATEAAPTRPSAAARPSATPKPTAPRATSASSPRPGPASNGTPKPTAPRSAAASRSAAGAAPKPGVTRRSGDGSVPGPRAVADRSAAKEPGEAER
jgi:translation initiation factor IF-3